MTGIPLERKMLYLMVLGLVPIVLVLFYLFSELGTVSELNDTVQMVQDQALLREKKQALNTAVRNHYTNADHFYIDKQLETLDFLEPELASLEKVVSNRNFTEDPAVKKRLEFLSEDNYLQFSEGVVQSMGTFQDTVETLVRPVEVNVDDIKKILAKIEGVQIGPYGPGPDRPLLIIQDFKLSKKDATPGNEVFVLDMKLLKREFL